MLGDAISDIFAASLTALVLTTLVALLVASGVGVLVLLVCMHLKAQADAEYEENKYDTRRGE